MPEQYLTESHYLVCDKGVAPKKMKVTSQNFVTISGAKVATVQDTLRDNNFVCLGKTAFMAGVAAGVAVGICALFPGPGWLVAAIIAAAVIAAAAVGYMKCKAACGQRIWNNTAERFSISGKKVLTLSSVMICPAEGGVITPKETFWSAWGSAALTNLGHAANFAFGFLVGRGATGMVTGAGQAAAGATTLRQGASTFAKELGSQFLNTAKTELVEQFTFKGIKNASTFCKIMRGLGIGGAYYEQYNIWSSDKSLLDKVKESGIGLILSIFAAKGATYVCFPAGTKVHTKDGLRDIEDIREGELLLTCNVETQENEYKPVLVRHERFTLQMLSLELPTGEMLCVTPEHRFYSNGSWVEARDLRAGDLLQLKEKNCYTTLISVETLPHYEKVYNFDIADNENYYVTEDGILVHNGYSDKADDLAKASDDSDFDISKYKLKDGQKLGDFGEDIAEDYYRAQGYDEFYAVQNRSGNGVDIVARNSETGDMVKVEVKTTRQDRLWNGGETREIPMSKDQRQMGGENYTNDRLNRAAKSEDGYTDGHSSKQAKKALKDQRKAKKTGAKVKTEKLDIYVDKTGKLRGKPEVRKW